MIRGVYSIRRNGMMLSLKIPPEIDGGTAPGGDGSNLEDDEACDGGGCNRERAIDP